MSIEEGSRKKEGILDKISTALEVALRKGREPAVIVNVGNLNQAKIAETLPPDFTRVSVKSLLQKYQPVPKTSKGLIVTGYSGKLNRDEEERVQSFVRATVANTSPSHRADCFPVVVLSNSLPKEGLFNDGSLPWFNGPFEDGDKSVYSIEQKGNRVRLKRHAEAPSTKESILRNRPWIDKEEIEF